MSILTQATHWLREKAVELFPPNSCLLCGADGDQPLCRPCAKELPRLGEIRCPLCAEPLAAIEPCGNCLRQAPRFDATFAVYRYDFPVDRLIHAFKYGGQLALGRYFGEALGEAVKAESFDLLVPMPLHPRRLTDRGFNQSVEIARHVCRSTQVPIALDECFRTRFTASQAGLPLDERRGNVKGAFECSADFSGKRILLVDDVMTTGSTLDECAKVLKFHGAARVDVGVIARAVRS